MSLDRKKLLTAEVKAELWMMKIIRKHEDRFRPLMESANANATQVQGNIPQNQPSINPEANVPERLV